MARSPRLKVFQTPVGFFDALVAAPSRKAALEAWGARGDLFSIAEAHEVTDPDLIAEALAKPGEVIRKPRGDEAALVAAAKRPAKGKPAGKSKASKSLEKAPPDRSDLDAAEAAIAAAEIARDEALDALATERERLEAKARKLKLDADKALVKLRAARDAAERAYKAAAG